MKIQTKLNRRKFGIAALALCLIIVCSCGAYIIGYVYGQGAGSITTTGDVSFGNVESTQPMGSYTYTIYPDGANYKAKHINGTVITAWTSTIATNTINNVTTKALSGSTISIKTGTYSIGTPIIDGGQNGITITGEKGALLIAGNALNTQVIYLTSVEDWLIQNLEIDGNSANQAIGVPETPNPCFGVVFQACKNCQADNLVISNCRQSGFAVSNAGSENCGITNSKLFNNSWNGMLLGANAGELGCYAINNEVAYSADVGISTYAFQTRIENNYIHDLNGSDGYNDAQWGIGVEGGGYAVIQGNTVDTAKVGIWLTFGNNAVVANNVNNTSTIGIGFQSDSNLITGNTITQWNNGADYKYAINGWVSRYNRITSNQISSTYSNGVAIYLQLVCNDTDISMNTIKVTTGYKGIDIENGYRNSAENNRIVGSFGGGYGVDIGASAVNATVKNNNFLAFADGTAVNDGGSGSIIATNITP